VLEADGSLTNIDDSATLLLAGVSDTAMARVGSGTYLYAAGATDNGLSNLVVSDGLPHASGLICPTCPKPARPTR
jgi:hypothetical protein